MNPTPRIYGLAPAAVEWDAGTPGAPAYRDVYFSRDGGLAETGHVFIAGNRLRERWAALAHGEQFCIGETGFGTGLNFLCCWALWKQLAPRGARLHFSSCERAPLSPADLERAHAAFPALASLAAALRQALPQRVRGQHRVELEPGVTLDLLYEEAETAWSAYVGGMDAWFLDGFAPSRNPDMWSEPLLQQVALHSRPNATLATWSVAASVRERLQRAGFVLSRQPGFGHKREMLTGTFAGASRYPRHQAPTRIAIIGGGLAGSALATALAKRGIRADVYVAPDRTAAASDTPRAVLFARLSPYDNPHARMQLSAYQHALRIPYAAAAADSPAALHRCGVLQCADDATVAKWRLLTGACGLTAALAQVLEPDDIQAQFRIKLAQSGLWFPGAGWISPPEHCRAALERAAATQHRGYIRYVQTGASGVCLADQEDHQHEADLCIVAAGCETTTLIAPHHLPLHRVRGQYTAFPTPDRLPAQGPVVCGKGFLLPDHQGRMGCGASYDHDDDEAGLRAGDHRRNLQQVAGMSPQYAEALAPWLNDPAACSGHVAWRATLPGRLPAAGALDERLHVLTGLGSRGLVYSDLCAELVVAQVFDEPWPVERELAQALDPRRF